VVKDFSAALDLGVAKIVGVSDDLELVAKVEKLVQDEFEHQTHTFKATPQRDAQIHDDEDVPSVSAARSQPYYLDVTHPKANKGSVVEMLSKTFNIPMSSIATIGDMPNDVLMFRKGGWSIAMGQANEFVRGNADRVSAGLNDEGFAIGVENFILGNL
jgi:hydroxymethylpyrimidine pyrophosphatase-like HAD family hydrolase